MLTFLVLACAPREPLPVSAPEPSAAAQEVFAGHEAIAEALDMAAIRCFVGTEHDGAHLRSAFGMQVVDGWLSHAEPASGPRWVQVDGEPRARFKLSWSISAEKGVVQCRPHEIAYASLRVRPLDKATGEPVTQVSFYTGWSVPEPEVSWDGERALVSGIIVDPELPAALFAECSSWPDACGGGLALSGLSPGEVREIDLPITRYRAVEHPQGALVALQAELILQNVELSGELYPPPETSPLPLEEQVRRLEQLDASALPPGGAALVEAQRARLQDILHRKRAAEADFAERHAEKAALLKQIEAALEAGDEARHDELIEALRALPD